MNQHFYVTTLPVGNWYSSSSKATGKLLVFARALRVVADASVLSRPDKV